MVHSKAKGKKESVESDSDTGQQRYQAPFGRPSMDSRLGPGVSASKVGADRQNLGMAVDSMLSRLSTLRQSSSHNKPAELFRKDLISAMKLPDSEILNPEDFYEISDCWRQEWEKGVQVPVNPDTLLQPLSAKLETKTPQPPIYDFRMPKKYLHSLEDENFKQGLHELTGMQQLADQVVRYDLDDQDVAWLQRINQDREIMGDLTIQEWTMERVIEALETECHDRLNEVMRNSEGLGIEYDEDVICDVCRSPDSEDTNEMVFCDNCDICLHQACYGIQSIPEGSWLCRTCALGIQPACILCPNKGGAMKSTKSGTKWCHVSCALWIPEVSIGCVEKMEPITKISRIPSSRWELICCICREKDGACIQCCVKSCKTSFHVTCAFNENLDMKTILGDEHEEVKLKAYCPKHTKRSKDGEGNPPSLPCSPRKQYTEEEKNNLRQKRIQQIEEEFYSYVDVTEICGKLSVCDDVVRDVYEYWKLKRRTNFNRPLLMARREEADLLSKQQEDSLIARMKMFVHLRQDLERVRNLCYMVSRREKTRRSLYNMKEDIFGKQLEHVLSELVVSSREMSRILSLNHGTDIYDQPEYILAASQRFNDCTDENSTLYDKVASEDEKKSPRSELNGLIDRTKREKLKSRLLDNECALAALSSDNDCTLVSDRVSSSPESDRTSLSSNGAQNYDSSKKEEGNKLTVAGHTVRVKGLKRVTRLPSQRTKDRERNGKKSLILSECNVVIDNYSVEKTLSKSVNEESCRNVLSRLEEQSDHSSSSAQKSSQSRNASHEQSRLSAEKSSQSRDASHEQLRSSAQKSSQSRDASQEQSRLSAQKTSQSRDASHARSRPSQKSDQSRDSSDKNVSSRGSFSQSKESKKSTHSANNRTPVDDKSHLTDNSKSISNRTLRPASRNLLESFVRVEANVTKEREVSDRVQGHDEPSVDLRRVEPLRVSLGKRDVETESTSSESSHQSTSSSNVNGYRRHSDMNGRHRRRTKKRHSSPSKRQASPVKCTIISPVKLKLTLTDQSKDVKQSEDSGTSSSKDKSEEKSVKTTTVSVADMLKLRRSRKIGATAVKDSVDTAKRRKLETVNSDGKHKKQEMADMVDSDSERSRIHRRSHHS